MVGSESRGLGPNAWGLVGVGAARRNLLTRCHRRQGSALVSLLSCPTGWCSVVTMWWVGGMGVSNLGGVGGAVVVWKRLSARSYDAFFFHSSTAHYP